MPETDVKLVLDDMFGDEIKYIEPKQVNMPTFFFLSSVSVEDVVNSLIHKNDITACAKYLNKEFREVDFKLDGEFKDEAIKSAWMEMKIPDKILLFFSELFDFNVNSFYVPQVDDDSIEFDRTASKFLKVASVFQIMYYIIHKGRRPTPLHLMNSIAVHDTCRSKCLVNSLNHIGVGVSYEEVLRVRNYFINGMK